jgi:hypothetical protein
VPCRHSAILSIVTSFLRARKSNPAG